MKKNNFSNILLHKHHKNVRNQFFQKFLLLHRSLAIIWLLQIEKISICRRVIAKKPYKQYAENRHLTANFEGRLKKNPNQLKQTPRHVSSNLASIFTPHSQNRHNFFFSVFHSVIRPY